MYGASSKACGDSSIADDLQSCLSDFPPQLQWLFLQHLQKNPFPDQPSPYSLINLWKIVPMPAVKEEKAQLVLLTESIS
jgi:hypothetical protein